MAAYHDPTSPLGSSGKEVTFQRQEKKFGLAAWYSARRSFYLAHLDSEALAFDGPFLLFYLMWERSTGHASGTWLLS